MTFEDAILKAIKNYFKGQEPEELYKTSKKPKYNKKYFDAVGSEYDVPHVGKKYDLDTGKKKS